MSTRHVLQLYAPMMPVVHSEANSLMLGSHARVEGECRDREQGQEHKCKMPLLLPAIAAGKAT